MHYKSYMRILFLPNRLIYPIIFVRRKVIKDLLRQLLYNDECPATYICNKNLCACKHFRIVSHGRKIVIFVNRTVSFTHCKSI